MTSKSEAECIATQMCAQYEELDFEETMKKLKTMSPTQFRSWKSDLQGKKVLRDG